MKPADQEKEPAASLRFMQNPNKWPMWPVLPVKRRTSRPGQGGFETGVMLERNWGEVRPVVYLCSMFDIPVDLEKAPKIEFPDFWGVVDAGWVVD